MSTVYRSNRKAADTDIIRLNSLGFSLSAIGRQLGCHPTTITQRLHSLNIKPADTRRTFMEDVVGDMPQKQVDWLASQLGAHRSIKDYIKSLLVREFTAAQERPSQNQGEAA